MLEVSQLLRYLARLGLSEPPPPTLSSLTYLQRQHLLTFPFENLCLHVPELRAPIVLDEDILATKIIDGPPGRGGYCFELNTLFTRLLVTLGFRVTTGAARVLEWGQPTGELLLLQPLTHMVLFVDLDEGRQLVDVGFGARGQLAPIPLRHLAAVTDAAPVRHRLRRGDAGRRSIVLPGEGWYLQIGLPSSENWEDLHFFTEARYFAADYEVLNYYTSTSPASIFTRHAFWCRPLAQGGRLELCGPYFRRYSADESIVEEVGIHSLDDVRMVLDEHCGLRLP